MDKYEDLAIEHADFLCDKIFKPAFIMGFVHGAKHAKVDVMSSELRTLDYRERAIPCGTSRNKDTSSKAKARDTFFRIACDNEKEKP